MEFTKMHGLGNDYIFLYCPQGAPEDGSQLARRLSQRHTGVGGDGLICICPAETGDFRMVMFNADGSLGEMCGNGIRCLGKYVYDRGLTQSTILHIETGAGLRTLELHVTDGQVDRVTVDMGVPKLAPPVTLGGEDWALTGFPVDMGNPHLVCPVESVKDASLESVGLAAQSHPAFPQGVNVELVRPRCPGRLEMRVWERGSGETMACGTGASAAVAAMSTQGLISRRGVVELPGGELELWWREDGHMYMTGPAVTVFDGKLAD